MKQKEIKAKNRKTKGKHQTEKKSCDYSIPAPMRTVREMPEYFP